MRNKFGLNESLGKSLFVPKKSNNHKITSYTYFEFTMQPIKCRFYPTKRTANTQQEIFSPVFLLWNSLMSENKKIRRNLQFVSTYHPNQLIECSDSLIFKRSMDVFEKYMRRGVDNVSSHNLLVANEYEISKIS